MSKDVMPLSNGRREFLKGTGALLSTVALPTASLSMLAFPRVARAEYVTAIIAVVSAVSSLMQKGGGTAKQMGALDLKLDQVLQNQMIIASALDTLQKSIDALPTHIAGLFTNEIYRQVWVSADDIFNRVVKLVERKQPPQEKVADYNRVFEDLYKEISRSNSQINNTITNSQGVASILPAGKAMLLYMNTLYAMANFEMNLPEGKRWKDHHADKFNEMAQLLRSALKNLINKRIPEALNEQQKLQTTAYTDAQKEPWGRVFAKMVPKTIEEAKGTESKKLHVCFNSAEWPMIFKAAAGGISRGHAVQTSDFTISYRAHAQTNKLSDVIFTDIESSPPSQWAKAFWARQYDRWLHIPEKFALRGDFVFLTKGIEREDLSNGVCLTVIRNGSPDQIREGVLLSEFEFLRNALARHANAVLARGVLGDINAACQVMSQDTINLEKKIAEKSKPEKSFLETLWDWELLP